MVNCSWQGVFLVISRICHSLEIVGLSLIELQLFMLVRDGDKAKQCAHKSRKCQNYKMGPWAFTDKEDFIVPREHSPVYEALQ